MNGHTRDRNGQEKGDRALALYEKGLSPSAIGERLGVPARHVQGMIQRARQRREKMAGEVVE